MSPADHRRSHPRRSFLCFARYQMLNAASTEADLLCITKDFSHDGLYFLALNNLIRLRMQLLLKFPYLTDAGRVDRICLVEVVRTQDLFPGRFGVGVRLLSLHTPMDLRNGLVLPEKDVSLNISYGPIDFYV